MVVSFDCYGTLVDWESGIVEAVSGVFKNHGITLKRDDILDLYSKFEPEAERVYRPYKEVLRIVMESFGEHFGVELSENEKNVLVDSIGSWPVFPDTPDTLKRIKDRHRIAVISNVDDDLFEMTQKKIGVEFDHIVTAQRVEAYKPSLKVFEFAHKEFGVSKDEWIHVGQSVYHDVIPAKEYGIKTILVKRRGFGATPKVHGSADYTVENLRDIIEILDEISQGVI